MSEFNLDEAIPVLARTPHVLRALLADLSEGWIKGNVGGESWSPYDILGHFIHGERTDWMPRARIILEHGNSMTFEEFDRFAQFEESREKSTSQLLAEFEELRATNLKELRGMELGQRDLAKKGMHPDLGEVTLEQLLATWVAHDLSHLGQIAEVMARQYRQAVGPWRAYLPAVDAAPANE